MGRIALALLVVVFTGMVGGSPFQLFLGDYEVFTTQISDLITNLQFELRVAELGKYSEEQ